MGIDNDPSFARIRYCNYYRPAARVTTAPAARAHTPDPPTAAANSSEQLIDSPAARTSEGNGKMEPNVML